MRMDGFACANHFQEEEESTVPERAFQMPPKGGGHRPLSQKQKQQQLKDKREKKRGAAGSSDEEHATPAIDPDSVDAVRARMTTSLGKSGHVNQFSTVFVKETSEAVAERKNHSDEPVDTSRRAKGLFAIIPNR